VNKNKKGSSLVDAILTATIIILVVLPTFSFILEGYIYSNKIQVIRDAVDISNTAILNCLDWVALSKAGVVLDHDVLLENYKQILAANLFLDEQMNPEEESVLSGRVIIEELVFYAGGSQAICPLGTQFLRNGVHSIIDFTIKPTLYSRTMKLLTGTEFVEFKIHSDTEIPANN